MQAALAALALPPDHLALLGLICFIAGLGARLFGLCTVRHGHGIRRLDPAACPTDSRLLVA